MYVYSQLICMSAMPTRSLLFKQSLSNLIFFSSSKLVALTKVKDPNLSNDLLIVGGRIFGCIPFTRVLALGEMQTISSRI